MLQLERRNKMMELFKIHKDLTVKELCSLLHQSAATIRRDLTALEQQGVIKRSFGGAVLIESFFDQTPLSIRSTKNIVQKKLLCEKAVQHINDGDTIFIDNSSTTYFLAPLLKKLSDITVITNNPYLNITLSQMKIKNFSTGGKMLFDSVALTGSEAEKFVSGIYADKFFFSSMGCKKFISDSSKTERDIKLAMLKNSKTSYYLYVSSKEDQDCPYIIANKDSVNLITI